MYFYFRSPSLRKIRFVRTCTKDCVALLRAQRNKNWRSFQFVVRCVEELEVMSKYIVAVSCMEPNFIELPSPHPNHYATALSTYLECLSKKSTIKLLL